MALHFKCDCCRKELDKPGALLFGPPIQGSAIDGIVSAKFHICETCYNAIIDHCKLMQNVQPKKLT